MRKMFLFLCGTFALTAASAQFDASQLTVSVSGNYTLYKGDLQRNTYGPQVRVGYNLGAKTSANLSFTMGAPIKEPSTVELQDQNGNYKTVNSELTYKFKTFTLNGNHNIVGDYETAGSFYLVAGTSYVIASFSEEVTEAYDKTVYTPMDQVESSSEKGFTINLGAGGQYTVGRPIVFGEAGLSLPANRVGNTYVTNYIPAHFTFNVGIKIPLGAGEY